MEYISGNIFLREMRLDRAGDVVEGHTHNFDHTTYVVRGAIQIETLGESATRSRVIKASDGFNWVLIKADVNHKITALEDNTLAHCIYSHRNPQGEVVQAYDGWTPGYL